MTADEALEIVEQILPPGTITPVKALVFCQSWMGKDYGTIAKESGYDDVYIRDSGAQLWRSLTHVLREPVKKKNFRTLLQQRFTRQVFFTGQDITSTKLPVSFSTSSRLLEFLTPQH
jgi:hypothetical protein